MTGSNLPPGVTTAMIPGNRPEDEAWDAYWDSERPFNLYLEHITPPIFDDDIPDVMQNYDLVFGEYESCKAFKEIVDEDFKSFYYGDE